METQRALHIAKREWQNIRLSLQSCGDIGELVGVQLVAKFNRRADVEAANFSSQSPIRISKSNKNSLFVRDLIDMDYKPLTDILHRKPLTYSLLLQQKQERGSD